MADRAVRMDVRSMIVNWPDDAPRGAVSRFCDKYEISRSGFYEIRARARAEGPQAALLPRPRSVPDPHPQAVDVAVEDLAVTVRKRLADQGLDHGPVTVAHEMRLLGVQAPAVSTLARIFTRRGMVTPQPQKKPKTAWRRFEFAMVHECWQLDAFDWFLADGSSVAIFQLLDDKSRVLVASRVAEGERSADAMAVVRAGIDRFQVPCLLLSDNGTAFNQTRMGRRSQLVTMVKNLGCKPITGMPGHPQTQGKDERVHQTLQKWLTARPAAETIEDLAEIVDAFDEYYNHRRAHQSLGMRTPAHVLADGPVAIPPLPSPTAFTPISAVRARRNRVAYNGNVAAAGVLVNAGSEHAGTIVTVIDSGSTVNVFDAQGIHIRSIVIEPGRTYYGNGQPRGPKPKTKSRQ